MSLGLLMMTGGWEVGEGVLQVDARMRSVQSDGGNELRQSMVQRGDESLWQPILCFHVSGWQRGGD